ncbi:MAG: hypothetical protein ACLT33_13575 [Lachnospira pectinoschiza]
MREYRELRESMNNDYAADLIQKTDREEQLLLKKKWEKLRATISV